MKKYGWIISLVIALCVGGIIYFYSSNSDPSFKCEGVHPNSYNR